MKCPHCLENFFDRWEYTSLGGDPDGGWSLKQTRCSSCNKIICTLTVKKEVGLGGVEEKIYLVRPKGISRSPISKEIPDKYADDYKEACLVLADSPKASAALSRRCLQNLLREVAHVKPSNLSNEIQEIIDSGKLPSHLLDSIDAIRNIGNFAAHPNKSESTGEIIDVEPGEAEWGLDVLEGLSDFYFIQPTKIKKKKEALNKKLKEAGKPEMK
jgi:hypothetical protein